MKNRFLFVLILLVVLVPACASAETPSPTPSPIPIPSVTASTTPSVVDSLPDQFGSPPLLNLADSALASAYTASVSQQRVLSYEGTIRDGNAMRITDEINYIEQSQPEWLSNIHHFNTRNNQRYGEIEIAILKGVVYSGEDGKCTKGSDKARRTPLSQQASAVEILTGTARRVEVGKTLNGVLVDRYELQLENLRFRSGVTEFISGSVYRAREGGYLVNLEYSARVNSQYYQLIQDVFPTDKPALLKYSFHQTFTAPGALKIAIPEICK
jgi:hypothetical protein